MISREFEFLAKHVARREKIEDIYKYPPSIILIKSAHYFNTSYINGAFGSKDTLTRLGVGKSVYALKTLYYTYNRNWNIARKFIVFMPQHFLALFEHAIDNDYRIPAILWDDASFWIGKTRWQSELVKTVKEFMGVIRTHCRYLIFTAPKFYDIARSIREELSCGAIIERQFHEDILKDTSIAKYYSLEELEKIYSKNKQPAPFTLYKFKLYFQHYNEYEEFRKTFVFVGKERMKERLEITAKTARQEMREILRKYSKNRKLDDLIEPGEIVIEETV